MRVSGGTPRIGNTCCSHLLVTHLECGIPILLTYWSNIWKREYLLYSPIADTPWLTVVLTQWWHNRIMWCTHSLLTDLDHLYSPVGDTCELPVVLNLLVTHLDDLYSPVGDTPGLPAVLTRCWHTWITCCTHLLVAHLDYLYSPVGDTDLKVVVTPITLTGHTPPIAAVAITTISIWIIILYELDVQSSSRLYKLWNDI